MASENLLNGLKAKLANAVVQRVVGVIALVGTALVIGVVNRGLDWMSGNSTPAEPAVAESAETPAANTQAAEPVANATPDAQAAPVAGKGVAAQAASTHASAPVVTAVRPSAANTASVAHIDEQLTYQYNALGRRDPYQSLVAGEFVGADVGGDAPPDPGGLRVVGIVWGADDQFALAEDARGNSHVLRRGDKVMNGVVTGLKRDAVMITVTNEGQSQTVTIPLERKGDSNAR